MSERQYPTATINQQDKCRYARGYCINFSRNPYVRNSTNQESGEKTVLPPLLPHRLDDARNFLTLLVALLTAHFFNSQQKKLFISFLLIIVATCITFSPLATWFEENPSRLCQHGIRQNVRTADWRAVSPLSRSWNSALMRGKRLPFGFSLLSSLRIPAIEMDDRWLVACVTHS